MAANFTLVRKQIAFDLPHFAFATGIAIWCAWFGRDAWSSQADTENLILILPAAIAAIVIYGFVAAGCFRVVARTDPPPAPERRPLAPGVGLKIAGTMFLLAAFVVAAPLAGFDVASFVYILAMLFFLGERRVLVLLLIPTLFCAIAIWLFDTILATPLPLLLLPGAGS